MTQLDFPNSAAAVRLHGREFHEQDFFDAAAQPASHDTGVPADASPPPARPGGADHRQPAYGHPAPAGDRVRKLVRWTMTCIGLALAAAVVMSWLVWPDLKHVTWIDTATSHTVSSTR